MDGRLRHDHLVPLRPILGHPGEHRRIEQRLSQMQGCRSFKFDRGVHGVRLGADGAFLAGVVLAFRRLDGLGVAVLDRLGTRWGIS